MPGSNKSNEEIVAELERAAEVFGAEGNAPGLRDLAELVKLAADRLAISPLAMTSAGAADVLFERQRQQELEGFTIAHDAAHASGELALAAACYVAHPRLPTEGTTVAGEVVPVPFLWPWGGQWWKPGGKELADYRRRLVKGTALAIAEIDRIDRMEGATHGH